MFVCENACLEPIYIVLDNLVNVLLSSIGPSLLSIRVHFHSLERLHLLQNGLLYLYIVSFCIAYLCITCSIVRRSRIDNIYVFLFFRSIVQQVKEIVDINGAL